MESTAIPVAVTGCLRQGRLNDGKAILDYLISHSGFGDFLNNHAEEELEKPEE